MTDAEIIAAFENVEKRRKEADDALHAYTKLAHDRITKVVNELKKAGPFPTI